MSEQYSRRYFLRAAFLSGGVLAAASLAPALLPVAVKAGAGGAESTGRAPLTRTSLFMGTIVSINVANVSSDQAEEGMGRAFAVGRQLAAVYSRFDSSSALCALNAAGSLADTPPALMMLLKYAQRMSALTKGAFDMTVLPVLRLFEARRNPEGVMRLDQAEMREALELVGAEHVRCRESRISFAHSGMGITLDGIAKGHIAQAMSQELATAGCPDHLVNAGGDIVARGRKAGNTPWRIAVEDPHKRGRFPQIVDLASGGAMATSGGYEVFYDAAQTHNHLVSPATGQSPELAGVTVTAPDGLTADALATALAVMPPREALKLADALPGCACCLLRKDGLMHVSTRWPGQAA